MRNSLPKLALAVGVAAAAACGPSTSESLHYRDAQLRVVNGSATVVSVAVDGQTVLSALDPGTLSAPLTVKEGSHQVGLLPVGSSFGIGTWVTVTNRGGRGPALVAALGTTPGAVSSVALADTGAVPALGTAKLQAVHLAAKAPELWVWRRQPDFPTPVTFMFPHPYGMSTSYIQAPPGTWDIYVTPAGVAAPTPANTLGKLSIAIAANQALRVAVLDSANGFVKIVPLNAP